MRIGRSKRAQRLPNEVVYYGQNGEDPDDIRLERMDSNGGWIATPTDLVRFAVNVGGFENAQQILNPCTIKLMTKPSAVNKADARGWGISDDGSWTHNGSLPGTSAVIKRIRSGFCWAAIANTRRPPEEAMNRALSNMVRDMAPTCSWLESLNSRAEQLLVCRQAGNCRGSMDSYTAVI